MENHAGWYATAAQSLPRSLTASRDTQGEAAKKIGSESHKSFNSPMFDSRPNRFLTALLWALVAMMSQFDQTDGDTCQPKDPSRALQNFVETILQAVQFLKSPGVQSFIFLSVTLTNGLRIAGVRHTSLMIWILRICCTNSDQRRSSSLAQRMKHAANHAEKWS